MGALALLKTPVGTTMSDVPTLLHGSTSLRAASSEQRRTAELRLQFIGTALAKVGSGVSIGRAAEWLAASAKAGQLPLAATIALQELGNLPSLSTIKRWLTDAKAGGMAALLPEHTGRVRQDYGWEARAIHWYNIPSKPGYTAVALHLQAEGYADATESRVRRYLRSMPATLGAHSPARVGPHLHKLTRRTWQQRHTDDLAAGEVYAGDGHTIDCYVAHPNTGHPCRLELTAFICIKTGYLAGWWFTESESGVSTLYALSHALRTHDHVPSAVYIDRGAGYRNAMMADSSTGFYAKFGIEVIAALPGNPHGKGWIERFFRTVRDRHDKFFDQGRAYCGHDAADETNRRMSVEVRAGRRQLPSAKSYIDSFAQWVEHYHHTPQEQRGDTPAKLWAQLQRVKVELPDAAIMRPAVEAKVFRQRVQFHKRSYFHQALGLYDAQSVRVEYDLHDDAHVWCYDPKGRFICQATLASTIGVLPISRLEEMRDKRTKEQGKRLERKLAEVAAKRQDPITAEAQIAPAIAATSQPQIEHDDFGIDVTKWSEQE